MNSIAASYAAAISLRGEIISVQRIGATAFTATARAVVTGFAPNEMIGDVRQGDRKVIILADDLISANFPLPLRKGDKVVVRGETMNLETADDSTRRVAGTLIAIECTVRGRP